MKNLQAPDWQGWVVRAGAFRWVVVALLAGLVACLSWGVSLRELNLRLRAEVGREHELRQMLAARGAQLAEPQVQREALHSVRERLQEARWRLDAGEGMSELLDQLAMFGHEHGLLFEHVEVLDEEPPGAGFRRVPLAIRVQGDYPSLRVWLEQWLQQLRLLQITRFSLARVEGRPGLLSAQLQVRVYYSTEVLPVPATLADEPARAAIVRTRFDPFAPWSYGEATEGLGHIALEQLRMVGSLSRGGRHQALLQGAGRLYRVEEGQRLGRDEGVVVGIDPQRVEVRERLYMAGDWHHRTRLLVLEPSVRKEFTDEVEVETGRVGDHAADEREAGPGDAVQG